MLPFVPSFKIDHIFIQIGIRSFSLTDSEQLMAHSIVFALLPTGTDS